jgi:hypothetical protein
VDSIFMAPQLGVLSTVQPRAATEVFDRDCLIHLGTVVAPVGEAREGREVLKYTLRFPAGRTEQGTLAAGEMRLFRLGVGESADAVLSPAKGFDVGAGRGAELKRALTGGVVGIVLDGRGRPFQLPEPAPERVANLSRWMRALEVYPEKLWAGALAPARD